MLRTSTIKKTLFLMLLSLGFFHTEKTLSMLPDRQAFIFFAVHDGTEIIAVQSNPLLVQDDSLSPSLSLNFLEVRDAPAGGGSPVLGFGWSPGPVSSAINIFATPTVSDIYWSTHATVYGRFEVRDSGGGLASNWESPFFLRTIDTINFDYTQFDDPLPIDISGGLPTNPPEYNFIGFEMEATPKGNLLGINGGADADILIDVSSDGEQANLQVMAPPYDNTTALWDIPSGPFDLIITSQDPTNPFNMAEHHFNGLDYLGNPLPAAQPTITLHPDNPDPDQPTNLSVIQECGNICFDWSPVAWAAKYSISLEGTVTFDYIDGSGLHENVTIDVELSFGTGDRTDGGEKSDSDLCITKNDLELALILEIQDTLPLAPEFLVAVTEFNGEAKVKALNPGKNKGKQNNPFSLPADFNVVFP